MRKKRKKKSLTDIEMRAFAQSMIDGKMLKQAAADFNISEGYAYTIFNQLLTWKAEWKHKE